LRQNIYIAGSRELGCIKIGVTQDLSDRHAQLNFQSYGGAADWELLFHVEVDEAGRLEDAVHAEFACHEMVGETWKDGRWQPTKEIFRVKVVEAYEAIAKIIQRERLACDRASARKLGDWRHY
jgi:hypothetical protein